MTLHEYRDTLVVMDGKCTVAKASRRQGQWLLRVYNASWADPRARTQGLFPGKFPYLMTVKSKTEARAILSGLLGP